MANKLSAIQLFAIELLAIRVADAISEAARSFCFAADWGARIGIPLLLKTSLPRPAGTAGATSGRLPQV